MRWEYKVSTVPTTPRELQTHLDQDGADEWELISTTLLASRLLLLFKRPQGFIQQSEPAQEESTDIPEEQPALTEETSEQLDPEPALEPESSQ